MNKAPIVETSAVVAALAAFIVVGLVGLFAHVPAVVILQRAAMALFLFAMIGGLIGYVATKILSEGAGKRSPAAPAESEKKGEGRNEGVTA